MQGIRDIRNNKEQFGFENKSNVARPSGSSINNPVHSASAATKVGNPIATSEALSNQKSPFDLSQSGQQSAENDKGSQPIQGPYRSPVQVSDDSDVEYIIGYRDIQNSIPDQNNRSLENREYHSSVVDQFYYNEGGRSRFEGRYHFCNVPTNAREALDRREGFTLGSMSNVLNGCPQLNDNLLQATTNLNDEDNIRKVK